MKAITILEQVLKMNETEQQGIISGYLGETWREWLCNIFGRDAILNAGLINPKKAYFYTYGEPLKGVADAIITDNCGAKVYIYRVED